MVTHVPIQVPSQRAHHGLMVPLCDVHRQGSTLRHRVDVVVLRGYNFLVPAHGGFSAPRTRVHDGDLVVKRIRRGKSVAGPTPIERLHLGKALWLGVKVIAALSESATVPPTWRNYRYGEAHAHTGAFPGGASWPYTADMRCMSAGKHYICDVGSLL